MAKKQPEIPTPDQLDKLADEQEQGTSDTLIGPDGQPVQPVDKLAFCLQVARAPTAAALDLLLEEYEKGLRALEQQQAHDYQVVVDSIAARRALFITSGPAYDLPEQVAHDPSDDVLEERMVLSDAYPIIGGTKVFVSKGKIIRWTRRELREGAKQGMSMRALKDGEREQIEEF